MKLKTKIIFTVISIYLLVNMIFTSIYIHGMKEDSLKKLNKKIENISLLLNQVNSGPLFDIDTIKLETNLKSFLNSPEIIAISLKEIHANIEINLGNFKNIKEESIIKKLTKITHQGDNIGEITTYYTTELIDKELNDTIFQIIIFSLLAAFIISTTLYILINKFILPITKLTSITSEITSGNLDKKITINSEDEIAELANEFETMRCSLKDRLNTIDEQNKRIKEFNVKLEKEIKERTKELLEQKETFETLFNDTADGLSLIKNGKFIECNNAVLTMLEYKSKDDFLNKRPHEISPEYQASGDKSTVKSREHFKNCMKKGYEKFEWIHLKSNNEQIWFEIVLTKIKIKDENIIHVVWRDIEEQKILEDQVKKRNDELLEQKNMFETLVDAIPDIVWMKDTKGVYLQCNQRFTEFFGANQKDIVGKTDYDFVDKELADLFKINDNKAMHSNVPHVNYETIPFASDGHEEYTQTIKTAVKNQDGSILGILGIGRDFTEEQIQKEELETAIKNLKTVQNKLVEAEKMSSLGVLVAGIAHEINTPVGIGLTGVTHFLELTNKLKDDYDNENMCQETFENYLKTSKEIADLINTNLHRTALLIKNFKQISFDQSSEEKRKINLKTYIDEILFSMNTILKKTNINIENNCDKNIDIYSYPGAISQIITNLIINSIKHGFTINEKGNIKISAHHQEQIIKLIYKDDGKGIPEENLPKIFDPFFTTNREEGGTGLGLNILYNIISNTLNGTIKCKSKENEGVEFIILFQENENNENLEKEILWQI